MSTPKSLSGNQLNIYIQAIRLKKSPWGRTQLFSTIRNLPQWVLFQGTHPLYSYSYFLRPVVHVFTKRPSPASNMIFFQESKDQFLFSNHFFFPSKRLPIRPLHARSSPKLRDLSLSLVPPRTHINSRFNCAAAKKESFPFYSSPS